MLFPFRWADRRNPNPCGSRWRLWNRIGRRHFVLSCGGVSICSFQGLHATTLQGALPFDCTNPHGRRFPLLVWQHSGTCISAIVRWKERTSLHAHIVDAPASHSHGPKQISETLGFATGVVMLIVCSCTGNCYNIAQEWHQYIRKVSHLTRWAFRSFHHGWEPERVLPIYLASDGNTSTSSHSQLPSRNDGSALKPEVVVWADDEPTVIDTNDSAVMPLPESDNVDPSADVKIMPVEVVHVSIASAPVAPGE
jgi:hypothetical protein